MILDFKEDGSPLVSQKELEQFCEIIPSFPHVAVDTEGDFAVEPNLFLGSSMAFLNTSYYFPVQHMEKDANVDRELLDYVMRQVEKAPLRVFHHAGHDLMELEKIGYPMWHLPYADTMIMAHMIDENVMSKSLDYLHKYYTGGIGKTRPKIMQDIIDTMGWRYVPVTLMNVYAPQDTVATSELFMALEPLYTEQFGDLYG